jgi:hypothetical protein
LVCNCLVSHSSLNHTHRSLTVILTEPWHRRSCENLNFHRIAKIVSGYLKEVYLSFITLQYILVNYKAILFGHFHLLLPKHFELLPNDFELLPKDFELTGFQFVNNEGSRWRLFQKRVHLLNLDFLFSKFPILIYKLPNSISAHVFGITVIWNPHC